MELYDDIIKAREVIKNKFNELRRGRTDTATTLEKHFKPLVDPLKQLVDLQTDRRKGNNLPHTSDKQDRFILEDAGMEVVKNLKVEKSDALNEGEDTEDYRNLNISNDFTNESKQNENRDVSQLQSSYLLGIRKKKQGFDLRYGLRQSETGELMIGSQPVTIDETNELTVNNEKIYLTLGLFELLCKKDPQDYVASDLENYKRILELTNAHRFQYDSLRKVYRGNSQKYRLIISKLYPPTENKSKKGSGVFIPQAEKTYLYWDDPNELVERLSLLLASKQAGHTGHEREILSIEEELREAGYIK